MQTTTVRHGVPARRGTGSRVGPIGASRRREGGDCAVTGRSAWGGRGIAVVLMALSGLLVPRAGAAGGATAVAVGQEHTCAVTSGGRVQCWGANTHGQLGDGTTTSRSYPADVSGLTSGVLAVAAGDNHTCAVTSGNGVRCWGDNSSGQLGDGSTTQRTAPVDVSGLTSGVVAIAAGGDVTCALTSGGGVKCWGENYFGQLGDGSTDGSSTPVNVTGLTSGVTAIAAGGLQTCAVTGAGGVKCWGDNSYGQLGDGTTNGSSTPVAVSGLMSGATAVAAGSTHTCAATSAGVKCWGDNSYGQLGDGTTNGSSTPVAVSGLTSAGAAVSAGFFFTCAVTGGGVTCWGLNNFGQLGDGTTTQRTAPVAVTGLTSGGAAVAAGTYTTCAVTSGGGVKCWGDNAFRQLGDGTSTNRATPVDVSGLTAGVGVISSWEDHTCAPMSGSGMQCWGANDQGQLGDGTTTARSTPVAVSGLTTGVSAVATGFQFSCAVTSGGGVKCWGTNANGELGTGTVTSSTTPVDVAGLTAGVVAITAGLEHACAVTSGGAVACWGGGTLLPVFVSGLTSGVVALAAGDYHTCALTSGGAVRCWGSNTGGQLGNGTTNDSSTPVDVTGLTSGVIAVVANSYYACALTKNGGVKCWGDNSYGELGDGTTTERTSPVGVSGLSSGATRLAAGRYHACAVTTAGGVRCWGSNSSGQLGDDTTTDRWTPVAVTGLARPIVAVTAGLHHTCVLTSGGGVQCWGDDTSGQLGDGRLLLSTVPVGVVGFGKTAATVTLTNLIQVYNGSPRPATATTTPSGLTVTVTYTGMGSPSYGPTTTAPTAVGTYLVSAAIADSVYQGTASNTMNVVWRAIPAFTDNPLTPDLTPVRSGHLTDLRTAVNYLQTRFGLTQTVWTDSSVAVRSTVVKAVHMSELRTALAGIYAAAGRTAQTYTHPVLTAKTTAITAVDIAELRAAVLAIW